MGRLSVDTSALAFGGARAREDPLTPYRQLAIRVLARALRDLSESQGGATERESARLFFAGSPMLFHWCRVAELDPRVVVQRMAAIVGRRAAAASEPASVLENAISR